MRKVILVILLTAGVLLPPSPLPEGGDLGVG